MARRPSRLLLTAACAVLLLALVPSPCMGFKRRAKPTGSGSSKTDEFAEARASEYDPAAGYLGDFTENELLGNYEPVAAIDEPHELDLPGNEASANVPEAARQQFTAALAQLRSGEDVDKAMSMLREAQSIAAAELGDDYVFPESESALGDLEYRRGDCDAAIEHYERALAHRPMNQYPIVYRSLAQCYRLKGDYDKARMFLEKRLLVAPHDARAVAALGDVDAVEGKLQEALARYIKATKAMPEEWRAWMGMARVHEAAGRPHLMLAAAEKAVHYSDGRSAESQILLGNAHRMIGKDLDEAVQAFRRATKLAPDNPRALVNLASSLIDSYRGRTLGDGDGRRVQPRDREVLEDEHKLREAAKLYRRLHAGGMLTPEVALNWVRLRQRTCDWHDDLPDLLFDVREMISGHAAQLDASPDPLPEQDARLPAQHILTYDLSADDVITEVDASSRSLLHGARQIRRPDPIPPSTRPGHRVRVGFVSAEFGTRPIGHVLAGVLRAFDRSRVTVLCYGTQPSDGSELRDDFEVSDCDEFTDVSNMPVTRAAKTIHEDRLAFLIDTSGYGPGGRVELLALKPAPILIHWPLLWPGPLAMPHNVDFVLGGPVSAPASLAATRTERVLRLKYPVWVSNYAKTFPSLGRAPLSPDRVAEQRALLGVPSNATFVFAAPSELYRVDQQLFDAWLLILQRVPGAVLWLPHFPGLAQSNLRDYAATKGIGAHRFVFHGPEQQPVQLPKRRLADLLLDTRVLGDPHDALDAYWAGTPFLTIIGDRLSARQSAEIAGACDPALADQLVVASLDAYVDRAVFLATNPDKHAALVQQVRDARKDCVVFQPKRWATHLETCLLRVFRSVFVEHVPIAELGDIDCV